MPMILDNVYAPPMTVQTTNTNVLSVSGGDILNDEHLTVSYIANITKAPTTTGSILYTVNLYTNDPSVPVLTSGTYRQTLTAGDTYQIISLQDFYNTIQELPPFTKYRVSISAYTFGANGRVTTLGQRLHVETK